MDLARIDPVGAAAGSDRGGRDDRLARIGLPALRAASSARIGLE